MNVKIENGKLLIVVPVDKATIEAAGLSSSQKSKLVASTRGFRYFDHGIGVSLNVTAPLA